MSWFYSGDGSGGHDGGDDDGGGDGGDGDGGGDQLLYSTQQLRA